MAASLPPFPTPEAGPAFHPEAGPFYCGIGPVTGGLFSSQRARTSTLLHPRDYPGAGHGGPLLRGRCLTPWAPASRRTDPRRRLRVTGGHAEQVAAAAGSPQKAALLAAGRDFGLGPRAVIGALLTSRSHQGLRPEGKEPFGVCAGNPDGG